MIYKVLLYVFAILLSVFALSGLNIDNLFKKNHVWEARIFMIIVSIITGYLLASFMIDFLKTSIIL